jgi:hypothetical protein
MKKIPGSLPVTAREAFENRVFVGAKTSTELLTKTVFHLHRLIKLYTYLTGD